jgi:hypothetical protein
LNGLKKVGAIVLLLVMIVPFYGTKTWYEYQLRKVRKSVKWQMIDGMEKSELESFTFALTDTATALRWIHAREFEFAGWMYDIAYREYAGDSVHYWCWWDYAETKLNRELLGAVAFIMGKNPYTREKAHRMMVFYRSLFFERCGIDMPQPEPVLAGSTCGFVFEYRTPDLFIDPPPPKAKAFVVNECPVDRA